MLKVSYVSPDFIRSHYRLHHTSLAPGYVSRKPGKERVWEYSGRFGTGYVIDSPNFDSTRFFYREYYLHDSFHA